MHIKGMLKIKHPLHNAAYTRGYFPDNWSTATAQDNI